MKKTVCMCLVAAMALPSLSYAWGPEASEIIARSALSSVRRDFADALANNEAAVVEGCSLPLDVILDEYVRESGLSDPTLAVGREINVMRDVARLHFTEYAAFRFGIVGRIAAEIVMPFGFPKDDLERSVKLAFETDIEKVLNQLRYRYEPRRVVYSPTNYFAGKTRFLDIAEKRIAADYRQGVGFRGYARRAAPEHYKTAVSAMADVWFTILKDVKLKIISKRQFVPRPTERMKFFSSRPLVVEYFADEVVYFIEKDDRTNLIQESYLFFTLFNQELALSKPYEQIGDAFMAAGNGPQAIIEYRRGLNLKPTWNEVRNKIVRYYLTLGQNHLDSQPRLPDYDPLKKALAAYETLLEVDPSHPLGNEKKKETELAIAERERRYNRDIELVGKAREVTRAADELGRAGTPVAAIIQYKNAIALFGTVSTEFSQPYADAEQGASNAETLIDTIFGNSISSADELIAQAQQRELEGNWAAAIQAYDSVPESLRLFRNEQFTDEYSDYYAEAATLKASAQSKRQLAQQALEQQQAAQPK